MYDASTKIPNGLVAGNYFDLGHFDECYGIQYGDIYGKYCLGAFPFNQMPVSLRDPSVNTTVDRSVSFCTIFSCSIKTDKISLGYWKTLETHIRVTILQYAYQAIGL